MFVTIEIPNAAFVEKYLVQALLLMKSLIRKTSYNQDLRGIDNFIKVMRLLRKLILYFKKKKKSPRICE